MVNKRMVLIFEELLNVHLGKDVFYAPYYYAKDEMDLTIVHSNHNEDLPLNIKGAKIERRENMFIYILKEFKNIDELMIFHLTKKSCYYGILYKLLNKKGKLYIKLDTGIENLKEFNEKKWKWGRIKISVLRKLLIKKSEKISVETQEAYDYLLDKKIYGEDLISKLHHIPNGFDEEELENLNIKVKAYLEKENLAIIVSRFGSYQKNNELLLSALDGIDILEWNFFLIGPYDVNFKKLYDEFIQKNPDKKEKVRLLGNISDKEILYSYYNKAKVFILTSRYEGFPLVFPEALRFGNYILTTDVSGAKDITKNSEIGKIIPVADIEALKKELKNIIANKINLNKKYEESIKFCQENFIWSEILKKLK